MWQTSKIQYVLLLISTIVIPLESAVCSIDLGSEWLKVAVVNLKPGQTPISIAINEMSKRKTPSLVAFHDGNRLIGEEAAGIVARYPEHVYSQVRDIIGKPFTEAKQFLDSVYLPFNLVEDSRGSAGILVDDHTVVYSPEELVAMILSHALHLAESHSKVPIKDAVITVPPYFTHSERMEILRAAEIARINVLSLINEHSGAALQYGIDKNFANESRHVIFYDMGSSSTYAALVHFSAYNAKEYGKMVPVNQFQVKDVRWRSGLGGLNMELRLVEYFADEFNQQLENSIDVRKFPKSIAKLKKQVKRTKEILSANTVAPISVESLHGDRDFRSSITREKFEELCADIWEEALIPVKEVLNLNDVIIDDIYALELIGGATRVPKLQSKLQDFLGRKDVGRHLDADEAVVLGAALHAANLSDGIKLNRKLGMIDGISYGILFELEGPDSFMNESVKQLLVPRMKKVPSKIFRSFGYNNDFQISLSYDSSDYFPSISSEKFVQYIVSGLANASERYSSRNLSSPVKANLHFSLGRSGVITLDRAEAVIEFSEWVEVPIRNLQMENSTTMPNTSVGVDTDNGAKQTANSTSTTKGAPLMSNTITESPNTTHTVTEKKLKKRTFRVPLKVTEKMLGPGQPLLDMSIKEAREKLQTLDKKDAERRRTAELKNDLEGYIYSTKEKLEISMEVQEISTDEERRSFIQKLEEVQDWLYMDGENAAASEFEENLNLLKAIGDPIFFRVSELTARPAAFEYATKYLDGVQQKVNSWGENKTWVPKVRIDEIVLGAAKLKTWLEDKEMEQKNTPAFIPPAVNSSEVYDKVFDLQEKVENVDRIPKPKIKVEEPSKGDSGGSEPESSASSNSTTDPLKEESQKSSQSAPSEEHSGNQTHDEL